MPSSHWRPGTDVGGGGAAAAALSRSVPSSPHQQHVRIDRPLSEVVGSADNLVGRVSGTHETGGVAKGQSFAAGAGVMNCC